MTTLADTVIAAMPAILGERIERSFDDVWGALPQHIRDGRPTKKLIKRAIAEAGWTALRRADGIVFRAPAVRSDPLAQHGDNIAGEQLRLFIERIERLIEERDSFSADIRDVFAEAKSTGFDVKTMRHVVRIRKMEKHVRDEADALLEIYRSALGMA